MTLLKLTEVDTFYGGIQALKGITIDVEEGEIVTLIGSNGAGKSTTLKSISGQAPVNAGSIVYKGTHITKFPPHQTARLGIAHVPEGRK
ncbi:ATP-binding cassette domain-containing protein, partial [Priestia megaterium]